MKRAGGVAQAGEKQPAFLPAYYVCASFVHLNKQNPRERKEKSAKAKAKAKAKANESPLCCFVGLAGAGYWRILEKKGKRAPLCPDVTREVAACGDMRHGGGHGHGNLDKKSKVALGLFFPNDNS